jgi:hypothetical protein
MFGNIVTKKSLGHFGFDEEQTADSKSLEGKNTGLLLAHTLTKYLPLMHFLFCYDICISC